MKDVVGKVSHWNILPQLVLFLSDIHSCKVTHTVISLQLAPDFNVVGPCLLDPGYERTIRLETEVVQEVINS